MTPGKVNMCASQTSPSATLPNAMGSRRPCRRIMASVDASRNTTARVTIMVMSSAGTYQLRGNVRPGSSVPRTETSSMTVTLTSPSRPRLPIVRRRDITRSPGAARTGGTDMPAICMAGREREVKELSRFVTNSDSDHPALSAGCRLAEHPLRPDHLEEGGLLEDRHLEALRPLELRTRVGADHEVVRLLRDRRANGPAKRLDPLLGLAAGHGRE